MILPYNTSLSKNFRTDSKILCQMYINLYCIFLVNMKRYKKIHKIVVVKYVLVFFKNIFLRFFIKCKGTYIIQFPLLNNFKEMFLLEESTVCDFQRINILCLCLKRYLCHIFFESASTYCNTFIQLKKICFLVLKIKAGIFRYNSCRRKYKRFVLSIKKKLFLCYCKSVGCYFSLDEIVEVFMLKTILKHYIINSHR